MRNFRLRLPSQSSLLNKRIPEYAQIPDIALPELPSLVIEDPSTDFSFVGVEPVYPTVAMRTLYRALNGGESSLPLRNYRDHRQQYEGCLVSRGSHKRKKYLGRSGNVWTFSIYDTSGGGTFYREYTVNWDGVGNPWGVGGDKSNMEAGRYMITWAQWAVWFLVNGNAQYFNPLPIPSLFPQYNALNVGWAWVDYDLSLIP